MESKLELRKKFLSLRESLSYESRDLKTSRILEKAQALIDQKQWAKIFLYYAFKGEPNILSLAESPVEAFWGLPAIQENRSEMVFHEFENAEDLGVGEFGIPSPLSAKVLTPRVGENTLVLIPAIAASLEGFRIGYGKGFYDRYLAKYPQVEAALVLFEECLTTFQPDPHDKKAKWIITDQRLTST